MARLGIHTSIAGSLAQAAERAHRLGCNTFQIFSSSPRQWRARRVTAEEAGEMARLRRLYDLYPLAVHGNYLTNLASRDPRIRRLSIVAFRGEIERALALGAEYLITHPGSVKDGDRQWGLKAVRDGLAEAARGLKFNGLRILVENTAGAGGALGRDFEEVAALVKGTSLPLGCCVDTAHSYQAGFDLARAEGLESWLRRIHETVGLDAVHVIHTNDSRTALGSGVDRHEHIGRGGIGREGFRRLLNHPALRDKAFILETPLEHKGDDYRNLRAVRRLLDKEWSRPKLLGREIRNDVREAV